MIGYKLEHKFKAFIVQVVRQMNFNWKTLIESFNGVFYVNIVEKIIIIIVHNIAIIKFKIITNVIPIVLLNTIHYLTRLYNHYVESAHILCNIDSIQYLLLWLYGHKCREYHYTYVIHNVTIIQTGVIVNVNKKCIL